MQAVDMRAPIIEVEIEDYFIPKVLVDGGSILNIMTHDTMQKLGLTHLEPIPFDIRLADQQEIKQYNSGEASYPQFILLSRQFKHAFKDYKHSR